MNSPPPFTIRIRTEQEQDMDWMVQPGEITFRQALEVISQVLPHTTISAFEYDDDDGERITVRSDEEMKGMFHTYFSVLTEEDRMRGLFPPLIIYPRVGKTAEKRNIHRLKIQTSKKEKEKPPQAEENMPTSQTHQANMQPVQKSTTQAAAGDIKDILTCGTITESDLQYIEMLGMGNGGKVYRALHRPTNRLMAVKVMQLDVAVEVQRQIIQELEILYKCHSAAIIGFYGAFFVENRISICTEFMDGGSLDKYGQVPEPVLGRMAVSIVQGLLYMWKLKILHRDIKPSNILVNTSGEIKLCDFGVSVQLVESIARTYVGTNAYMAPERIRGEIYSTPAEVWSLGVALFELAMGCFPFQVKSLFQPMQLLNTILQEEAPSLPREHFSADFVDFVSRCMLKQPEQRLTAAQLTIHPFIQRHDDGNFSVVAGWVQSRHHQIQQQKIVS